MSFNPTPRRSQQLISIPDSKYSHPIPFPVSLIIPIHLAPSLIILSYRFLSFFITSTKQMTNKLHKAYQKQPKSILKIQMYSRYNFHANPQSE